MGKQVIKKIIIALALVLGSFAVFISAWNYLLPNYLEYALGGYGLTILIVILLSVIVVVIRNEPLKQEIWNFVKFIVLLAISLGSIVGAIGYLAWQSNQIAPWKLTRSRFELIAPYIGLELGKPPETITEFTQRLEEKIPWYPDSHFCLENIAKQVAYHDDGSDKFIRDLGGLYQKCANASLEYKKVQYKQKFELSYYVFAFLVTLSVVLSLMTKLFKSKWEYTGPLYAIVICLLGSFGVQVAREAHTITMVNASTSLWGYGFLAGGVEFGFSFIKTAAEAATKKQYNHQTQKTEKPKYTWWQQAIITIFSSASGFAIANAIGWLIVNNMTLQIQELNINVGLIFFELGLMLCRTLISTYLGDVQKFMYGVRASD